MPFQVGDTVVIKTPKEMKDQGLRGSYGEFRTTSGIWYTQSMGNNYGGSTAMIVKVHDDSRLGIFYSIDIDGKYYNWNDEMLKPALITCGDNCVPTF